MYRIRISGLGFIHKQWKDEEPRFCTAKTKAKTWKSLKGATDFGNKKLTPKIKIGWELWQEADDVLTPVFRPRPSGK